MTTTIRRRLVATLGIAAITLTACGGASEAPLAGFTGPPKVPAAVLLSDEQGRKLTRNVKPIASETPVSTGTAVGTVGGSGPVRTQGPPGNPVTTPLSDPPDAGFYPHRITVTGAFNTSGEFDVKFEEPESVSGGMRQLQKWEIQGAPQEFTYEWRGTQLLLTYAKQTGPDGETFECTFDPPRVELRLPLSVGESWASTSRCEDLTQKIDAEIIRTEQIHVGGVPVDTFVIKSTITTDDGKDQSTAKVTSWFAPEQRLLVRVDTVYDLEGEQELKTFVDLLALTPRTE